MANTADCTKISLECPLEDTVYGYRPNLGVNVFMVVLFGACAAAQVLLGIKYRLRAYPIVVSLGCLGECVGYVGRIIMHSNPWDNAGFILQILLLIVSPSLLAAGIYLTMKHLVIYFGPQYSRLSPKLYTWVFVACDAIGFLTQCIGGGIQASADNTDKTTLDIGNDIMIAGITFQAVTMGACGLLSLDFAYTLYRHRGERQSSQQVSSPRSRKAFTFYMVCFIAAFVTILIRCIYRIPEMAGGWKNELMRNEVEFMILDGAMIAIAAILLTVAFPGAYFPAIGSKAGEGGEHYKENLELSSEEVRTTKPGSSRV